MLEALNPDRGVFNLILYIPILVPAGPGWEGPMIIPYEKLSQEALRGLIEEFVTREGTDSGYTQKTLEENVDMVKRQLGKREAFIVYDEAGQTANIVSKNQLKEKN